MNLQLGVKPSLEVVRLQLQLRHLEMYAGNITGVFDSALQDSVMKFQSKLGLLIDGIAGSFTNTKLKQLTNEKLFCLFLHCAASPEGLAFSAHQIELMHTLPVSQKGRGWSRPGYSDIIELDKLVNIRPWNQDDLISEWEYTFGIKFETLLNQNSRHICYIGGMDKANKVPKDTRNEFQKYAMESYIRMFLLYNPKAIVVGHHQVQVKACPSFDVPNYLHDLGIPNYNIAMWKGLAI